MASYEAYDSPRMRRLRSDFAAMERLAKESSIVVFEATGSPPQRYVVRFQGKGLQRRSGKIEVVRKHEVEVKLGSSYPRTKPELRWLTPIFHPNISDLGMVCLGGFDQHWAPSLTLDVLCEMLWDMVRYHNYDVRSPYNREAAVWANEQTSFQFPIDSTPMRDVRIAQGRIEDPNAPVPAPSIHPASSSSRSSEEIEFVLDEGSPSPNMTSRRQPEPIPEVMFLD